MLCTLIGALMSVREFKDHLGREWRAWDVAPDDLNPRTRDETYLAQLYLTGWIVFETKLGDNKRRLYPIPKAWSELPDAELEVLLNKAEIVPPRKLRTEKHAVGDMAAREVQRAVDFAEQAVDAPERVRHVPSEETPDVTDLNVLRTFRYPTGRIWAVCVVHQPDDAGPPVLRFTAGARHIDLQDWPKDWADYPDEELANLLRHAEPRHAEAGPALDAPHRRWDDVSSS
jgi:hypothetical protein